MDMILRGKVHKYGSNVNTDEIIPARYLNTSEPSELAKHCLEDIDENFVKKVSAGDIIVATDNFGCGSSREHAPIAIKAAGVSAVIAASFARIFFRNALNIGLPILESPKAANAIADGDEVEIDFNKGIVKNISKDEVYTSQPFPEFMQKIISAGGLMGYIKNKEE